LVASLGIELMPLSVSVIGDQPSSPTVSACRTRNTLCLTLPTKAGVSEAEAAAALQRVSIAVGAAMVDATKSVQAFTLSPLHCSGARTG